MESPARLVKAAPSQDPRAGRADVIALKALMKSVAADVNDTPVQARRPHPTPPRVQSGCGGALIRT